MANDEFYEDEDNLKKLCDFLRGKEGPAVREAIEMDKRVHYLKGESRRRVCHAACAWVTSSSEYRLFDGFGCVYIYAFSHVCLCLLLSLCIRATAHPCCRALIPGCVQVKSLSTF